MRIRWIHACAAALTVALTAAPCVAAASGARGGAVRAISSDAAAERFARHDVFAVVPSTGNGARRYYVEPTSGGGVARITTRARMPWTVHVDYALNGPNVDAAALDGATGTVQVHVRVAPDDLADLDMRRYAQQLRTFAMFTVPAQCANDVSADDDVAVIHDGNTIVVSSTAAPGATLDMRVFIDATKFSMGDVTVAALSAASTDEYGAALRALGTQSAALTGSVTTSAHTDDGANAALSKTLTALRDQERTLAKQEIAKRGDEHQRAFHDYMAAYVGSYTNHLSGSVGTKTQMTALMGTAGELKGDTPLAHAVTGLATAVNNVSDAHQHTGAADEVDRIITRIRQQGTEGLADELKRTAGEQARIGARMYADGQGQLSRAMIPYSMAYTDVYTSNLNDLTGGDVGRANAMSTQAIEATNAQGGEGTLGADKEGVDAAMAALASAREHTGAANAAEQILQRFPDEIASVGTDTTSDAAVSAQLQPVMRDAALMRTAYEHWLAEPLGGAPRVRRAQRIAAAQRRTQAAHGVKDMSTLVTPSDNDASADISKYAGSVTTSIGGGSSGSGDGGGTTTSGTSDDGTSSHARRGRSPTAISEDEWMSLVDANPWERTFIAANTQPLIDETVRIASARPALDATADAAAQGGALAGALSHGPMRAGIADVLDTRFLIVHKAT